MTVPIFPASILAALWIAEGIWPAVEGRRRRFAHLGSNLVLAALNGLLGVVVLTPLIVLAVQSAEGFGLLARIGAPGWLEWGIAIAAFDLWQYFWHRLNHRAPFLWRFHLVHHADGEMDASTAVRFHPGEIALSTAARLAVVPLLGMSLEQLLVYELALLPIILFHHGNLRMGARLDEALGWFIVTPGIHRIHHSPFRPETDSNYASLFSLWDRLFRTYRTRDYVNGARFGLEGMGEDETRRPATLLLLPFRPRATNPD